MKKLAFLFLSFLSIENTHAVESYEMIDNTSLVNNLYLFDTEQSAQNWVDSYIINRQTGDLLLSMQEIQFLANCLFTTYQIVQLDELSRYFTTNKLMFHLDFTDELKAHYGCMLSNTTHDAFCYTFNCFKNDLLNAYQIAQKRFYILIELMEKTGSSTCHQAYTVLKQGSVDLVNALHTSDNYLYKQIEDMLVDISQEHAQELFNILSLEKEMSPEFIENLAENDQEIILNFIAFQEECTNASKDFFRIYLNTLLSSVNFPIMIMFENGDLLPEEKQTKKIDMINTCKEIE